MISFKGFAQAGTQVKSVCFPYEFHMISLKDLLKLGPWSKDEEDDDYDDNHDNYQCSIPCITKATDELSS